MINNGCNTQIVQIFFEEQYDEFNFSGNILSRLLNTVVISHEWVLTNFKYQRTAFHYRLFDESEEVPFEVTTGSTNSAVIIKPLLGANNLYDFQDRNIVCVLCSLSSAFSLLVKTLQKIVLKMRLYPHLNKSTYFNFLLM